MAACSSVIQACGMRAGFQKWWWASTLIGMDRGPRGEEERREAQACRYFNDCGVINEVPVSTFFCTFLPVTAA